MTVSPLRRTFRRAITLALMVLWLIVIVRYANPDPDTLTGAVLDMDSQQIGAYLLLVLLIWAGSAVLVDYFVRTADTAFRLNRALLAQTAVILAGALWIIGLLTGALFQTALFAILVGAFAGYATKNALEDQLDEAFEAAKDEEEDHA